MPGFVRKWLSWRCAAALKNNLMWFRRPQKNRRLGREFVLDVKLRSSQVRARRMRIVAVLLGGFFLAAGSVYLAWQASEWVLKVFLYENNAFAIKDIDVETDGVIASDQLRRWTGVRPGQNLFSVDLVTVRRNLELVSMVQTASVEKVLPRTLRLRVTEREPVAQLNLARPAPGGGVQLVTFYLDADGYVISPLNPSQCSPGAMLPAPDQLPAIVGVNASEVQPGRRSESLQLRAALELILAFQRSPMQGLAEISKVDVSELEVLVVKTTQGSEVTFALTGLPQQLARWQRTFEEGQRLNKAIATLDLAVSNNIPAPWIQAAVVPQIQVKSPKPLRNKKKHV